jgi:hypothetical protein
MSKNKIIALVILIVLLIVVEITYYQSNLNNSISNGTNTPPYRDYCNVKEDCVPEQSCHPTSVVNIYYAPKTNQITGCTAVCGGSLDCGAGTIDCQMNHCTIIPLINLDVEKEIAANGAANVVITIRLPAKNMTQDIETLKLATIASLKDTNFTLRTNLPDTDWFSGEINQNGVDRLRYSGMITSVKLDHIVHSLS